MKKTLILLILISFSFLSFVKINSVENICSIMFPRGGDEDWGVGGYYIPDTFSVNLYEDTLGVKFGELNSSKFRLSVKSKNKFYIKSEDLEYLGHYSYEILKVKNHGEKFVQVFWKTKKDGLLIKKEDLQKKGAKFFTYKDFLFKNDLKLMTHDFKEWLNIGVNLNKSCVNLREGPSTQYSKIKCVLGNDWNDGSHSHMKILTFKGNWAKVEVTKFVYNEELDESGEGCTFDEVEILIGWIKAIDDSGFPNIWYSVTSY